MNFTREKLGVARDIVIIGGVLFLIFLFIGFYAFPAPFNLRYAFKRIFYTPTYICEDGTYSFAATSSGACSGHGGIRSIYRK